MLENFSMSEFNYFDITIASVITILGIKGFLQGFIKEVFGLIGLIIGVYIGSRYAQDAGLFIEKNFFHLDNSSLVQLLGFLSILVVIWLSSTILGAIFSGLIDASGLGFLNRLFGFIAGAGKYFLIFSLIITALSHVQLVKDNVEKYVDDSLLYPYLKELGDYLIDTSNIALPSIDKSSSSSDEKKNYLDDISEVLTPSSKQTTLN